jgi:hypothetical protein
VQGIVHRTRETEHPATRLELVVVRVERGDFGLETLADTDGPDELLELAALLDGRAVHQLPVVHHTLREGLATGRATEVAVEAERLANGEVRLDGEHRGAGALLLAEDLTTTLVQARVDTTNGVLRALDLDYRDLLAQGTIPVYVLLTEVDRLLETRLRQQASSVADTTSRRDELSTATVDGVGVQLTEG